MPAIVYSECPCGHFLGFHSKMLPEGEFTLIDAPSILMIDLCGATMECGKCGRHITLRLEMTMSAMVVRGVE